MGDLWNCVDCSAAVGEVLEAEVLAVGAFIDAHEGGSPPIVFGAVRVVVVHVDVDGFAVVVEGDDEAVLLLVPPDLVPQELLAVLSPGVALQRGMDCWVFFGQCLFCASGCLLQVQEIAFDLVRGAIP